MISIKVCKLSDLTNKVIFILISCICLSFFYNLILKCIDKFSMDFIIFSINSNLYITEESSFVKEMIRLNLPTNLLNSKDDIEKEFDIADNNNVNIENINDWNNFVSEGVIDNHNPKDNLNSNKNNLLKFSAPYLLECNKISDSKYQIGEVTINSYIKKNLDSTELEKSLFTDIEDDCKVLIYHTHTSESYTGVQNYSDFYRTEDKNSNVVKVGEVLKEQLNSYGIHVRHDTTTHDYPSYNGAYKSSLNTVENILKNENYDIIIDVHRDALASNSQYRPTAEINGETVAKLMFVVGTNSAGLKHDNWIENLKFAIAVQQRANEVFPGLFRDLHLSTSRYNQHTSNKSIILEVGATGNTVNEACLAMKYFAMVLNSMR